MLGIYVDSKPQRLQVVAVTFTELMPKERIDKLLTDLGLASSRTKAQAMVMAGVVLVDEKRVEKPSETF